MKLVILFLNKTRISKNCSFEINALKVEIAPLTFETSETAFQINTTLNRLRQ